MDRTQLAEVLRMERARRKLTLRDVARAVRTSTSVLHDLEHGRRDARYDTVRRVLVLYGLDLTTVEACK